MPTSLPLIEQSRFKKHLKQLLQAEVQQKS